MISVKLFLLIAALVCFVIKAFNLVGRVDFMNLGFAFVVAAFIVS